MALTQFVFMGWQLLRPEQFGIVGSREQFDAFNHLWRVLGYMLGIEDRFNCCCETLEDTLGRLEAMRVDMMLPGLKVPCVEFDSYVKTAADAIWHSDPTTHYGKCLVKSLFRLTQVNIFLFSQSLCCSPPKDSSEFPVITFSSRKEVEKLVGKF